MPIKTPGQAHHSPWAVPINSSATVCGQTRASIMQHKSICDGPAGCLKWQGSVTAHSHPLSSFGWVFTSARQKGQRALLGQGGETYLARLKKKWSMPGRGGLCLRSHPQCDRAREKTQHSFPPSPPQQRFPYPCRPPWGWRPASISP